MMLAMNGSPLAGNHRGAQPGPEAEKVRQHGMEIDAAMGLAAMQVQGHGEDGELGDEQEIQGDGAQPPAGEAGFKPVVQGCRHEWFSERRGAVTMMPVAANGVTCPRYGGNERERSEDSRVGKEGVSTHRCRWTTYQ